MSNNGLELAIHEKLGGQIGLEIDNIREIMGDGTRIDRFVSFHASGKILVTTKNTNDIQFEIPWNSTYNPSDDSVVEFVYDGLMRRVFEANRDLCDSDTNKRIRQATPYEIIESFLEGPTGHFEIQYGTEARRVFAEF
jgi:hypothetical protein